MKCLSCFYNIKVVKNHMQYNILGFNEEIQEPQEVSMSGQTRYRLDLVFSLLYFVKMFL